MTFPQYNKDRYSRPCAGICLFFAKMSLNSCRPRNPESSSGQAGPGILPLIMFLFAFISTRHRHMLRLETVKVKFRLIYPHQRANILLTLEVFWLFGIFVAHLAAEIIEGFVSFGFHPFFNFIEDHPDLAHAMEIQR
jgi:hypothetical protein